MLAQTPFVAPNPSAPTTVARVVMMEPVGSQIAISCGQPIRWGGSEFELSRVQVKTLIRSFTVEDHQITAMEEPHASGPPFQQCLELAGLQFHNANQSLHFADDVT